MVSKVNAPSLPINMTEMITSLPAVQSSGVMPVERPTVPKAETTSKNIWIKLQSGSNMHMKNVAIQTTVIDRTVIIHALETFF